MQRSCRKGEINGLEGITHVTVLHCHSLKLVGDEDNGFVASLTPRIILPSDISIRWRAEQCRRYLLLTKMIPVEKN
jgi:hypothetical protein